MGVASMRRPSAAPVAPMARGSVMGVARTAGRGPPPAGVLKCCASLGGGACCGARRPSVRLPSTMV